MNPKTTLSSSSITDSSDSTASSDPDTDDYFTIEMPRRSNSFTAMSIALMALGGAVVAIAIYVLMVLIMAS